MTNRSNIATINGGNDEEFLFFLGFYCCHCGPRLCGSSSRMGAETTRRVSDRRVLSPGGTVPLWLQGERLLPF